MDEIARTSYPARVAGDGGDPAVERLREMAQGKSPPQSSGVEGEEAEGKVELEEGDELSGKAMVRTERRLDQALDPG
jgi:hypothetical protein